MFECSKQQEHYIAHMSSLMKPESTSRSKSTVLTSMSKSTLLKSKSACTEAQRSLYKCAAGHVSEKQRTRTWLLCMLCSYYYYYYYYRKKRFRWHNVKRLQGHLTNAKDSDKTRVRRKVRRYLSICITLVVQLVHS